MARRNARRTKSRGAAAVDLLAFLSGSAGAPELWIPLAAGAAAAFAVYVVARRFAKRPDPIKLRASDIVIDNPEPSPRVKRALTTMVLGRPTEIAPATSEIHGVPIVESAQPEVERTESARPSVATSPVSAFGSGSEAQPHASLWLPAGSPVTVAGYRISAGMIYVGRGLNAVSSMRGLEPALIDPDLPVDRAHPDRDGRGMSYWPSYSTIPASSRAAYLEWLASGRTSPDVSIGYVFLFYYGLERRLLADGDIHADERRLLLAEVERLLSLYGGNGSFRGYASSLVDVMRLQSDNRPAYEQPSPFERKSYGMPAVVRLALAQLTSEKRPIPADWAFAWWLCNPESTVRTSARRCPEEFRALFRVRYEAQFGEGVQIKPGKARYSASYRPASASFAGEVQVMTTPLPDVSALSGPLGKLQELAEGCACDLDSYSRWKGRNSNATASVEGAALLPPELYKGSAQTALQPLLSWLDTTIGAEASRAVPATTLLKFWPDYAKDKITKREAVSILQLLGKVGYGLEPDVRFGGSVLNADDPAVLFRLPEASPTAPSPNYAFATLMLHLSASVADSDGEMSAHEEQALRTQVESALHLSVPERARLRAHLDWLIATKPGMAGVKKRIASLDSDHRRTLARHLVAVAGADGQFAVTELTDLTKLYGLLGLAEADAYSDVHAMESASSTASPGPVVVQKAELTDTGFTIPEPAASPRSPASVIMLDMKRVQATLAETKQVATLLGDVFADTDDVVPAVEPPTGNEIAGLDLKHSALVRAIIEQASWSREQLEEIAAKHGLLPDGALDTINEATLDRWNEPLCDGDDPVHVNQIVVKELLG